MVALSRNKTAENPSLACERCGAAMRIVGIEAHPSIDRKELHTFACVRCGALQTTIMSVRH